MSDKSIGPSAPTERSGSKEQRLADAAREIAMEIASGRRLKLDPNTYCGCAAHYVVVRAGFADPRGGLANDLAWVQDYGDADQRNAAGGFANPISEATWHETHGLRGALVFPLLALADDLEALSRPITSGWPEAKSTSKAKE